MSQLAELGIDFIITSLITFAILIFAIVYAPKFTEAHNLASLITQVGILAPVGSGFFFLFLLGRADLSVGGITSLSSIAVGVLALRGGGNLAIALLAGLATGLICGLLNGVVIGVCSLPNRSRWFGLSISLLVTLVLYQAYVSLAFALAGNALVLPRDQPLPAGITGQLGLFYVCDMLLVQAILTCTPFGRLLYDGNTGNGNRGIRTVRILRIVFFALTGLFAAVSGLLLTSYLGIVEPSATTNWLYKLVAAAFIGCTTPIRGRGTLLTSLIGLFAISCFQDALALMNVGMGIQTLVVALLILLGLGIDVLRLGMEQSSQ